jgi:hypothetical protein
MNEAQQRFNVEPARAYALAIFSMHLEASTLPDDDARGVYEMTGDMTRAAVNMVAANKSP